MGAAFSCVRGTFSVGRAAGTPAHAALWRVHGARSLGSVAGWRVHATISVVHALMSAAHAALPAAPAGEPVEDTRMPGDAPAMPGEAGGAMPPGGMGGGDDDAARAQDEDLPTSRTCGTMDLHHQLLIEDPVYVRLRAEIEDRFQRWTHGHHVVGVAQGR